MRSRLLHVTTVLALAIQVNGAGTEVAERTGTQWFPALEWSFENPTWQGSAFDLVAKVEFVHSSSGKTVTTEMFYAGGTQWRFRFTGTQTGRWRFVSSSADSDLDGRTGRVTIQPNPDQKAHGFLKALGNKWAWQGTSEVFVPQLVMWDYVVPDSSPGWYFQRPDRIDARIETFLKGHGFNGFHLSVIGGRWFDIEAETDRVTEAMTEPDLRTFEALELIITRTHAAGGMTHIWKWGDHQRRQTCRSLKGGRGGPVDLRLQRYIAARLGPVPGWSMGYGFDLDEWVTAEKMAPWHDNMQQQMGWSHFLGGRPVGPNRGMDHTEDAQWNRALSYSSYEHHQPTYGVYRAAFEAVPGKPVMSEDRFRIRQSQYRDKDYSAERTRGGLYHSTLAGGVANIWGIHPDLSPGGIYPNKDQIKTYATFFFDKKRFLPDMEPANHLSPDGKSLVLSSPGTNSAIFYQEDTETVQADLPDELGTGPVIVVDTRRVYKEINLGKATEGRQTWKLPARSDWILAVGRFDSQ